MDKKFTIQQKKFILAEYIKLLVKNGYDIKRLMGRPLSLYDYNALQRLIKNLYDEYENQ
jgi:hypothetical protein